MGWRSAYAAPARPSQKLFMKTRNVRRAVRPGSTGLCALCDEEIVWKAMKPAAKIISNVYDGDRWDRVEQRHEACWETGGRPYGPIVDDDPWGTMT